MAFWGVEVKPGKPFTHKYDELKGRLHLSLATLGFGSSSSSSSSSSKSTLQCNVGNRSPVYLCSLYPGPANTESLQLNLELEEPSHDVIFSVIGPRSIHLSGYYLSSTPRRNDDHSESYGEDIADTDTQDHSHDQDDDYDDSFIDDDTHPEVFPPSPLSSDQEEEEETTSHRNRSKHKNKTGLRRLRKYQPVVESDDDDDNGCSDQNTAVNNSAHDQTKEFNEDDDNYDMLPISSLCKNIKASGRALLQEMDDAIGNNGEDSIIQTTLKIDNVLVVDSQTHREGQAEPSNCLVDTCTVLDVGSIKKEKKKKKGKEKETKSSCNGHIIKPDNAVQDEPKKDKMTHDLLPGKEQYQEHADNKEPEIMDKMLPSSEVSHGQGEKPKRKRKEWSKEEGIIPIANGADPSNLANGAETPEKNRAKRKKKEQVKKDSNHEGDVAYHECIINKSKPSGEMAESDDVTHKFPEGKEQHQKLTNEKVVDDLAHDLADGNQSEDIKIKKKKKKSKSQRNVEVANSEMPLSAEQSSEMVKEDGNKRANTKPSQVRKLSNGLVIEELEMGIKDGKIAASGKKISVHYTGMLKENGVVFESNAGQAPFKFRLGKGEVNEGWDVGLEGMRVGEKRRLVIPPSMTSKIEGHSAKIPPNSWLVYDLELVKVHH